ncbi:MAG: hypothetical protein KKD77_21520 [Gammaproteobacteria bacterium]|nr:hypothetical protein [Gammaproteobacteria bacterium]
MAEQTVAKLIVALEARVGNLEKDIKKGTNVTEKYTKTAEKAAKSTQNFQKNIMLLGKAFVIYRTIQRTISMLEKSVEAARAQIEAEQLLASSLGHTSKGLLLQSKALQKATTFGDEQVLSAQAMVAQFIKEEAVIKRLTPLILDFAVAKKMNVTAAADLVTKTIASSTNALTRYGLEVKGAAGSSERAESAIMALSGAFGGLAEALAKTELGKLDQLKNQISDINEEIGIKSLAPMRLYKSAVLEIVKAIDYWANAMGILGKLLKGESVENIRLERWVNEVVGKMDDQDKALKLLSDKQLEITKKRNELLDKYAMLQSTFKTIGKAPGIKETKKELIELKEQLIIISEAITSIKRGGISATTGQAPSTATGEKAIAPVKMRQGLLAGPSVQQLFGGQREEQKAFMTELLSYLDDYKEGRLSIEELEEKIQANKRRRDEEELANIEKEKQKRREIIDAYANYASQSFQIFDNIHQMRMNQIATEDQRERDSINANIKNEGARQRALEALSKKTEAREREERERQKKWAILQAIINGAEAIVRLWSIPGFPAAIPLAAVVAGITASQIGVIQSQKFAEGGRVGGRLHSQGGTPVEAEKNEYIMSRRATAKYGFGAMEAVNQGRVDPRAFAAFAGMRPLQPVGYYGTGGRVTPPPASNDKGTVNIVNFLDPALFEQWMGTIDGKRAIVNTIRRNSYEIRKVINI